MAPGMTRWLWAAGLGAAAIAVAYLPLPLKEPSDIRGYFDTPERRFEAVTDRAVRRAQADLRDAERRDFLKQQVASARPVSGGAGFTLLLHGKFDPAAERTIRATVDTMWHEIVPSQGAVRVVFVMDAAANGPNIWILPAATGGKTCGALMAAGQYSREAWFIRRTGRVAKALARCGYFAAFGVPGPSIDAWLARGAYELTSTAEWGKDTVPPATTLGTAWADMAMRSWINLLYFNFGGSDPRELACAEGNRDQCRAVLFQESGQPVREGVVIANPLEWRRGAYLADLVRTMGRERFGQFWRSPLAVDRAFASAFGTDLDRWTSDWQRGRMIIIPGTTAVSPLAVLEALLLVGIAFAGVAWIGQRRQVAY